MMRETFERSFSLLKLFRGKNVIEKLKKNKMHQTFFLYRNRTKKKYCSTFSSFISCFYMFIIIIISTRVSIAKYLLYLVTKEMTILSKALY